MQVRYISCLIILGLISISACKCNRQKSPTGEAGAVYIYEFEKSAPLSADNTKKLITEFLGNQQTNDLYVSKDDNVAYFVSPTDVNTTLEEDLNNGNISFSKLTQAYLGDLKPQLPSGQDAAHIGEKFLKQNGLFPKNPGELRLVHTGGLRAQTAKGPIIDKLVTLTYAREIDSMQVIGAGSKIVVNIGDKGEVVGLIRRWRELNKGNRKAIKPEEMISQEEATAMAKRQIAQEFGEKTAYDFKEIRKSYYDNNGNILQPVYVFETVIKMRSQDNNQVPPTSYLCVIPMLKQSPEPLNLTQTDPRAKELIKNIDRPGIDSSDRKNLTNID
ncbi:MAG: hypothetical protein JO154_07015 [Chitinophaga sp.]|uniref:hypothetical protein n=1 Tax=Chitinophaga sp. TaxID=1869181 RepID=UPI0025BD6317|nr:hypothetical protein [Chitinophaga sp.]MBV8252342.1 hypothetical protein [Chitinophaga sp.]